MRRVGPGPGRGEGAGAGPRPRPARRRDDAGLADEEAIRQILDNLIDNAIKYTPEGGSVRVALHGRRREHVADRGRPTRASASPATTCPRSSSGSTGSTRPGAASWGAPAWASRSSSTWSSRSAATIAVDSRLGDGSRFTVRLPRDRTPAPTSRRRPGRLTDARAMRIDGLAGLHTILMESCYHRAGTRVTGGRRRRRPSPTAGPSGSDRGLAMIDRPSDLRPASPRPRARGIGPGRPPALGTGEPPGPAPAGRRRGSRTSPRPRSSSIVGAIKTHFVAQGASRAGRSSSSTGSGRAPIPGGRTSTPLAARGFRVYAIDLKGFGLTAKPKDGQYHLDAYTQHLLGFLDAMKLDRPVLVGQLAGRGGRHPAGPAPPRPGRRDRPGRPSGPRRTSPTASGRGDEAAGGAGPSPRGAAS